MNAEVRRAFWVHYRNADEATRDMRLILTEIEGDLLAMRRAMQGDPSLIENGYNYIVTKLEGLTEHAKEIQATIRQKRIDGAEADARIDAMLQVAS